MIILWMIIVKINAYESIVKKAFMEEALFLSLDKGHMRRDYSVDFLVIQRGIWWLGRNNFDRMAALITLS